MYLLTSLQSSLGPDLSRFGGTVLKPNIFHWLADAEVHLPTVQTWHSCGKCEDELLTSEGWRKPKEIGIAEGMVAIAYENRYAVYSRVFQFLKYHLWTGFICICDLSKCNDRWCCTTPLAAYRIEYARTTTRNGCLPQGLRAFGLERQG